MKYAKRKYLRARADWIITWRKDKGLLGTAVVVGGTAGVIASSLLRAANG